MVESIMPARLADVTQRALPEAGERWRHYKGGEYEVVAVGLIEADLVPCVIYRHPPGHVWVRPMDNFMGTVDENGYIDRFQRLPTTGGNDG